LPSRSLASEAAEWQRHCEEDGRREWPQEEEGDAAEPRRQWSGVSMTVQQTEENASGVSEERRREREEW
jgi:hypothetical protein